MNVVSTIRIYIYIHMYIYIYIYVGDNVWMSVFADVFLVCGGDTTVCNGVYD